MLRPGGDGTPDSQSRFCGGGGSSEDYQTARATSDERRNHCKQEPQRWPGEKTRTHRLRNTPGGEATASATFRGQELAASVGLTNSVGTFSKSATLARQARLFRPLRPSTAHSLLVINSPGL